jgi:hypothetical protein
MKKKAKVVNLFGGPGIGKSTTAAGVFVILKLHNVECELVTEYAKDLVWEERHKTFLDQQYIFAKQNHRLWRVADKVDVIVTDCPLILNIIYGERNAVTTEVFNQNVVEVVSSFDNYNILLERTKKYNINGRNETEEEAKEVDKQVKGALEKHGISYNVVQGNFEGINKIATMVLEEIGIKPEFNLKFTAKGEETWLEYPEQQKAMVGL